MHANGDRSRRLPVGLQRPDLVSGAGDRGEWVVRPAGAGVLAFRGDVEHDRRLGGARRAPDSGDTRYENPSGHHRGAPPDGDRGAGTGGRAGEQHARPAFRLPHAEHLLRVVSASRSSDSRPVGSRTSSSARLPGRSPPGRAEMVDVCIARRWRRSHMPIPVILIALATVAQSQRPYEMVWAGRTEDEHPPLGGIRQYRRVGRGARECNRNPRTQRRGVAVRRPVRQVDVPTRGRRRTHRAAHSTCADRCPDAVRLRELLGLWQQLGLLAGHVDATRHHLGRLRLAWRPGCHGGHDSRAVG